MTERFVDRITPEQKAVMDFVTDYSGGYPSIVAINQRTRVNNNQIKYILNHMACVVSTHPRLVLPASEEICDPCKYKIVCPKSKRNLDTTVLPEQ